MNKNEYSTPSTATAAFIRAYGIKPIRIEKQGIKCIFVFEGKAQQFAAQYHNDGLVPGKRFAESHKAMLELIGELKRSGEDIKNL